MRRALRPEDLALVAWNAVAVPLVGAGAAAPILSAGEPPNLLAGLVQLAAVLGAIGAVATRPAGMQASVPALFGGRLALIGPLIGAVAFVAGSASSHLGVAVDGLLVGTAFIAIVAAAAFTDRLPTVDAGLRRALVTPFILVSAGIFDAFAADLLRGLDVAELIAALSVEQTGFAIFVIGLLLSGLAAFYAALVVAPRILVADEPAAGAVGCLIWPARFVAFLVSALFGIGWLVALTG